MLASESLQQTTKTVAQLYTAPPQSYAWPSANDADGAGPLAHFAVATHPTLVKQEARPRKLGLQCHLRAQEFKPRPWWTPSETGHTNHAGARDSKKHNKSCVPLCTAHLAHLQMPDKQIHTIQGFTVHVSWPCH